MFTLGFLKMFSGLLKSGPYIILAGILAFSALQLKSCREDMVQSQKETVIAKKETQDQKDAVVKQANDEKEQTIIKLEKSSQVTLDTTVNQTNQEKKVYQVASDREVKVKQELAKVLNTYNNSIKDLDASRLKDTQISTIQINSIWQSYCGMTPDDIQCKEPS